MNIVLIGAPLSGKGTQAKHISETYNLKHISTGDMFREIALKDSELGREVKKYMDRAMFVPDSLTMQILKERLKEKDCQSGVLLDGFPRTVFQAEQLQTLLNVDVAIYLKVKLEVLLERVKWRFVCPKCKTIYTITDGITVNCSLCGESLIKRSDDTEEKVRFRFDEFQSQTKPVVDFYMKSDKLFLVNAGKSIKRVSDKIDNKLRSMR